jgi:hypothetical protein
MLWLLLLLPLILSLRLSFLIILPPPGMLPPGTLLLVSKGILSSMPGTPPRLSSCSFGTFSGVGLQDGMGVGNGNSSGSTKSSASTLSVVLVAVVVLVVVVVVVVVVVMLVVVLVVNGGA